jgi:glutathione S-transferase
MDAVMPPSSERPTGPVVLRYFAAQGRVQAIRHALMDAKIAFEDLRVSLPEWPAHKEDPSFGGPFGSLPTLSWGDDLVAEALPIAGFVARRSGHYEGLGDAAIARLEAICSACYVDVTLRASELVYADLLYPGATLGSFALLLGMIVNKLVRLERLVPEGGWFGDTRPVMADFFAAEAVELLRELAGPAHLEEIAARAPRLTELAARVRERPAIAAAWARRPPGFTARADEAVALERIREAFAATRGGGG